MMRKLLALALLATATPLAAQSPARPLAGEELIDRVVAVVGDTALLLSDVQAALQQLQAAGRSLPEDPAQREQVAREVFEGQVDNLILVEAARNANTTVPDEAITEQVEEDLRSVLQRFGGSEIRFAQALASSGMTREAYRRQLERQYRDQEMIRQFMQKRMASRTRPIISEEQLREAFAARSASLGTRPTTVSMQQVIVNPVPSDSALAKAERTAKEVLDQLIAGGDFEVLAKRFSDDPGSKEHGGSLGWFKQGRMVKAFEETVFSMRPGQTSGLVKTEFGYHIIRLDKVRGPERQARHILIRPELTESDVQRARQRADSVATAIRGGANVLALAKSYGTRLEEAEVSRIPIDRLPPMYTEPLKDATRGAVIGPIEIEQPSGKSYAVVKVVERQEAGPYTLDDVREQLTTRLQEQRMMEQLIEELRREVFVEVRM